MNHKHRLIIVLFLLLILSCERNKSNRSIASILTNDHKRTWELIEIENVEIRTDCYIGDLYTFCSDSTLIINNNNTVLASEIDVVNGEIEYHTYCKDTLIIDTLNWHIQYDTLSLSSGWKLVIIKCTDNELIINFGDLGIVNQINHFTPVN